MRVSPVNRALGLPRLSYGVSSKALAICWAPGALVGVLLGTSTGWLWALIPMSISALIHLLLRWAYKKDHRIFEMYIKYALLSNFYHPNAREKLPPAFERPAKVGRGVRI